MPWSRKYGLNSLLHGTTKSNIYQITEGPLRVGIEVLYPQAYPVLYCDATLGICEATVCLVDRLRGLHIVTCPLATIIDGLSGCVPRTASPWRGGEYIIDRLHVEL